MKIYSGTNAYNVATEQLILDKK